MKFRTWIIQKLIQFNEVIFFYPNLRKYYNNLLKSKRVSILDIGANKGQSINFFLNIWPDAEIDAFEPNRKLFDYLNSKYSHKKNIRVHNLGISNINGELIFHENILDETSTFEELNTDSIYLKRKAKILGVPIDKVIVDSYRVNVKKISTFILDSSKINYDILKIDVEGHELNCLEGLFNSDANSKLIKIKYIQIESHYDDMYKQRNNIEIIQLLNKNGFQEAKRISHGFGDFSEIIFENTCIYEA